MRKLFAVAIALLLVAAVFAAEAETPLMGGWTPSADPTVTEELKAVFDQGTAALTGMTYVPVAYLGSQVVAGTNYAFLCQAISAYAEIEMAPAYAIIYLYRDLQGNVTLMNIADLDIGAFCTYGAEE